MGISGNRRTSASSTVSIMDKIVTSLVFSCLISGTLCYSSTRDVLWSPANCNPLGGGAVQGTVTDAICCNGTYGQADKCYDLTESNCKNEDTCHWMRIGYKSKCVLNRDRKSNVCCQAADIKQNCVDLMKDDLIFVGADRERLLD